MSTSYGYDEYARLVRRSFADRVLGDGTERFTYDSTYSNGISNGTLMSMRMVSGGNIVYQYDGLQRLTNKDIAGEVWETFAYSNTQVSSKINYIGNTRLQTFQYTYDSNGNITSETTVENDPADSSTTTGRKTTTRNYAYDKLNQLTEVKENGTVKESYTYDNAGNILTFNNGKKSFSFAYDNDQWEDLLTTITENGESHTITYDAVGNPLSYYDGYNYTFTWTEGRRLESLTYQPKYGNEQTTAYEYDYTGLRTKKANADGTYTVYHIADGRYVGETLYRADGSRRLYIRYIYDENDSVAGISLWKAGYSSAWEDYYFLKNLQGDVLRVYRASDNSLAAKYTYDAWGNIVASQNYHNFDGIAVSQLNPFRYRGYYFDNETYFYYLQSRYYDPAIGRFINADAYASTGQGFLGYNMFVYCNNNPANMHDPNGMCSRFLGFLWKTDCGKATCKDSKNYNPSPANAAVLYDGRTSGYVGGLFGGVGFENQGECIIDELEMSYNVEGHAFTTMDEFAEAWNSLEGEYERVYILSHGYPGGLSCAGKSMSNSGTTDYSFRDLNSVSATTVYLYSCNGATWVNNGSVADSFALLTGGSVWAVADGSLNYYFGTHVPNPVTSGTWTVTHGGITTYMN